MSFKGKFVVPRGSCGGVVAHELGHCALTTLIVTVPTSGNDRYELTVGPVVDGQRGRLFVRHGEMQPMVAADFEVGHSLKEAFGGEWQRTENADDGTAHFEQRVEGVINMQFLKKFEACWDERMGGVAKLLPSAQHISVLGPSSNSENLEIKWWQLLYGKFGGPSFQRNLHQLNARIVLDLKLGMPLDHSIKMCAKHMLHSKRYSVFDTYEIDRDGRKCLPLITSVIDCSRDSLGVHVSALHNR